jgi:hypothetical protein
MYMTTMAGNDADKLDTLFRQDIHAETARIAWRDLQYLFAGGKVIQVAAELDLVEVALQFSRDNRSVVEAWIAAGLIAHVSDQQAKDWLETDAEVWAVVVKPWVLVQTINKEHPHVH